MRRRTPHLQNPSSYNYPPPSEERLVPEVWQFSMVSSSRDSLRKGNIYQMEMVITNTMKK